MDEITVEAPISTDLIVPSAVDNRMRVDRNNAASIQTRRNGSMSF